MILRQTDVMPVDAGGGSMVLHSGTCASMLTFAMHALLGKTSRKDLEVGTLQAFCTESAAETNNHDFCMQ